MRHLFGSWGRIHGHESQYLLADIHFKAMSWTELNLFLIIKKIVAKAQVGQQLYSIIIDQDTSYIPD